MKKLAQPTEPLWHGLQPMWEHSVPIACIAVISLKKISPGFGGLVWGSYNVYRPQRGGVTGTIQPPRVRLGYPLPGVSLRYGACLLLCA